MSKTRTPKQIKLTAQDVGELSQRIKDNALSDKDLSKTKNNALRN